MKWRLTEHAHGRARGESAGGGALLHKSPALQGGFFFFIITVEP